MRNAKINLINVSSTNSRHHFYNCDYRIISELLTYPLGYDFIEKHIFSFFNINMMNLNVR